MMLLNLSATQCLIFCLELRHAALSLVHRRIKRSHAGKQKTEIKKYEWKRDVKRLKKGIAEDGGMVGKKVKKGIEKMRARIGKESREKRKRVVKKFYFLSKCKSHA